MTQTTEQARSAFLPCPFCGGRSEFNEHDELCYFTKFAELKAKPASADLTPMLELLEAWNRRAPAVLVPQGWKLVPVEPPQEALDAIDRLVDDPRAFDDSKSFWDYLLAAAPQPPEAAQLDDTNVADMAQAVDSKEAAPVQLPEYGIDTANHAGVRVRGYTKQQVRELLAAHGIKVAP